MRGRSWLNEAMPVALRKWDPFPLTVPRLNAASLNIRVTLECQGMRGSRTVIILLSNSFAIYFPTPSTEQILQEGDELTGAQMSLV